MISLLVVKLIAWSRLMFLPFQSRVHRITSESFRTSTLLHNLKNLKSGSMQSLEIYLHDGFLLISGRHYGGSATTDRCDFSLMKKKGPQPEEATETPNCRPTHGVFTARVAWCHG
jgi:hypothetical protein